MRSSRSFTKRTVRSLVVVFGGTVRKLATFWQSHVDHPSYAAHPLHGHQFAHRKKACPLFLHGDDVASIGIGKIWSKAVNCLSFGGILSQGSAASDSHILIGLMFNCIAIRSAAADTFKTLWRQLIWSLYWLYRGQWPTHAPYGSLYTVGLEFERAGQPLAGGV